MRAKQYHYTADDLSRVSSRALSAVWRDIREGKLDPDDLLSVYRYIHEHRDR